MTMPDFDHDLDAVLRGDDTPPAVDAEVTPPVSEPETSEVVDAAPGPAPAQPDLMQTVTRLAELQAQQLEFQRQQQERANQPAPPPAWVDPYDRPENIARLDDLEERATYDQEARGELRRFRRQLDDERLDRRVEERTGQFRAELQQAQQLQNVQANVYTQAQQYGDLVQREALDAVMNDVFQGQPEHVRAAALQDPTMVRLLTEAAAGRRVLTGQQRPPNAPARPTPPPAVQSGARGNTPPSRATTAHWNDPEWMNNAIEQAFHGGRE